MSLLAGIGIFIEGIVSVVAPVIGSALSTAATFIATSAGIDVTPANLATIAFLSICAAMGCPAIPIAGTTLIVTILSGLGWTSDACMIAYALVVAINRPVEMALLPLNVIGDATVNVIVNAKEKELDKEKYNS